MEVKEPSAKYLAKPAYKQTEVGAIPDDWDAQPLGNTIKLQGGYAFPSIGYCDIGIPVVRISNVQNGTVDIDSAICYPKVAIPPEFTIQKGDALLAMSGATTGKVGVYYHRQPAYQNQRVGKFVIKDKKRTSTAFITQLARSDLFVKRLSVFLEQGAQPNISSSQVESLVFAMPSTFAEQQAIAEALCDADELIETLEHLLTKKRQLKQGAMQELLTGQKRLPGFVRKWETIRLGEIGEFLKGSGISRDEAQSGVLPCVRYGEIYTTHHNYIRAFHSWISIEVAASATRLKQGDLLFAGSGETKEDIGKCIAFLENREAYAGGDIVILRPRLDCSPLFLGYAFNTIEVNRQKASRGQGDAVVHISAAALADIVVLAPEIDEQTAIATILSDMDDEIAMQEAKLAKARSLKQGLMQELLTGRIRLV